MAQLHITSLECLNRQDTTTRDDVRLDINNVTIAGPVDISGGEIVNLNVLRFFTGVVSVTAIEEDNSTADDILGTVSIPDSLVGVGNQIGRFDEAPNADYLMNYHVDA